MLYTGLVSISFRNLPVDEIISMCVFAGLDAIEWGGDVHVPHGNLDIAGQVREKTLSAGLRISSYGSYYRLAVSPEQGLEFDTVLKTAEALGAPVIRVWAGNQGSSDASQEMRDKVIQDATHAARMASRSNISVALEYHSGTLTDTNESARLLLDHISHPNLTTYWQPPNNLPFQKRMEGLSSILDRLSNIHVFHWVLNDSRIERRPLAEGENDWLQYLRRIPDSPVPRYALLEFFRNDDPKQFRIDAETLRRWLSLRDSGSI